MIEFDFEFVVWNCPQSCVNSSPFLSIMRLGNRQDTPSSTQTSSWVREVDEWFVLHHIPTFRVGVVGGTIILQYDWFPHILPLFIVDRNFNEFLVCHCYKFFLILLQFFQILSVQEYNYSEGADMTWKLGTACRQRCEDWHVLSLQSIFWMWWCVENTFTTCVNLVFEWDCMNIRFNHMLWTFDLHYVNLLKLMQTHINSCIWWW